MSSLFPQVRAFFSSFFIQVLYLKCNFIIRRHEQELFRAIQPSELQNRGHGGRPSDSGTGSDGPAEGDLINKVIILK